MKSIVHILLALTLVLLSNWANAAPSTSVVFVLDESGSVSSSNFRLETEGFRGALSSLPLDGSVEVSIVGFSSSVSTIVDKVELTAASLSSIDIALANNPKNSGGTNMAGAIQRSTSLLLGSSAPTQVIILATDGSPNNSTNATIAANDAKNSGILLAPIGIGLSNFGKNFLDSIASNPPVPNPADFTEFATVVINVIGGLTSGALNISLAPDIVDFGVVQSGGQQECSLDEQITLANRSNQSANITSIVVQGQDASAFEITKAFGQSFSTINFPVIIRGLDSTSLDVKLSPISTPADARYDATIVVTAEDENGKSSSFVSTLKAPIGASCLTATIQDASGVVSSINENGVLLANNGQALSDDTLQALDTDNRTGLVADGNARLLMTATTSITQGIIRFEILQPTKTESRFGKLDSSSNTGGDSIVDIDIASSGQATAVLRAGEEFLGALGEAEISYTVKICVLDDQGMCSSISKNKTIKEKRAPVVLIHGLWAGSSSWTDVPWTPFNGGAMAPQLRDAHFRVAIYDYESQNMEGPTVTMPVNNRRLSTMIAGLCITENNVKFACTRSDIVGHSMGGLVARKFIKDNGQYKSSQNFNQGSVRRLITLGTPHLGSGFMNLLIGQDTQINNCITDRDAVIDLIAVLLTFGKDFGSAMTDLSIGSIFLDKLNGEIQNVSTFALIGDTGTNLVSLDSATSRTGCDHADLFQNNNSDTTVSIVSAAGNIAGQNTQTLLGVEHVGMGTNDQMVAETLTLLNGPKSEFSKFAQWGPKNWNSKSGQLKKPPAKKKFGFINKAGSFFFGIVGGSTAHAQTMPSITLDVSNNNPSPSETIVFTASVSGTDITTMILNEGNQFQYDDNTAPYEWTFDLPNNASGSKEFKVVGIVDGKVIESNIQTIVLKPDLTNLQSLLFVPGEPLTMFPGQTLTLSLTGLFGDGIERSLTQAAMETSYSENIVDGLNITSGDSPVIDVSPDGVITAKKPGTAEVVANNNGQTALRRITVSPITQDDADGDDLTDTQEQSTQTDTYDPDSDGDGSRDNVEVGTDPSQPLDTDADGTIDALDSSTIVVKNQNGNHVSIKSSVGTLVNSHFQGLDNFPNRPSDLSAIDAAFGAQSFRVTGLTEGQSIDVTLTFENIQNDANTYLTYGPLLPDQFQSSWYKFESFDVSGKTLTLHLADNQKGDTNSTPGVISNTGALGNDPSVVPPTPPPTSRPNRGGGCSYIGSSSSGIDPILPLSLLVAGLYIFFRRRKKL